MIYTTRYNIYNDKQYKQDPISVSCYKTRRIGPRTKCVVNIIYEPFRLSREPLLSLCDGVSAHGESAW